ncbi:M50 family metallopeptidase [Candidatus Minimicrobia sp. QA0096]|uniref:M50 family metallopeptidase n=1 Tax=Candidatus Minimicrobia sp. QA0096 TaxID=3118470 RepID=UPI0030D37D61
MIIWGVLLGLFVLILLVVLHELGHAIVAKRNGVKVEEFGVGFPPAAKKWKVKRSFLGENVTFSLNWLPLGGFVRLKGEYDSAKGEGTYGGSTFWVKTKILLAGVVMNWITAIVLFTILAIIGMPKILSNQVQLPFDTEVRRSPVAIVKITPNSPADKIGLKVNDELIKINGQPLTEAEKLPIITKQSSGKKVRVEYRRDGKESSVDVQLNDEKSAKGSGYLGVIPGQTEKMYSTWSAPIVGVATTGQLSYETLKGVGVLLAKTAHGLVGQIFGSNESKESARADLASVGQSVAGPIGILGVLFPSVVSSGIEQIIFVAALISLTLAVMNILPIPALDGGRWFTMTIFRLFKKDLTKEREENIQATGMLILLILTILVTISDVGKLF